MSDTMAPKIVKEPSSSSQNAFCKQTLLDSPPFEEALSTQNASTSISTPLIESVYQTEVEKDVDASATPATTIKADPIINKDASPQPEPSRTEQEEDFVVEDVATARVAMVVHAALFFFALLFIIALVSIVIMVSHYGFIALVVVCVLVGFFVGLIHLVDRALKDEARFKPIRNKIRTWKAVATAVVMQEVRNFQLDWNEHSLLTNGDDREQDDNDDKDTFQVDTNKERAPVKPKKKRGGGRSVVFRMIKPFLSSSKRSKRGWRRNRKNKEKSASSSYVPPSDPSHTIV